MTSELDVPNLPFKKPLILEKLEQLGLEQREAMDPYEVQERIQESADGIAVSYREHGGQDYEGCVVMVSTALAQTGQALGGNMGAIMVGLSHRAARIACRETFPE